VESFPSTVTGKVQKFAMREAMMEEFARGTGRRHEPARRAIWTRLNTRRCRRGSFSDFGTLPRAAGEVPLLAASGPLFSPIHITLPRGAARLMDALGRLGVHLSTDAVTHTPIEVTERVMAKLVACNADCLVSLGGGSTIGLGKALALRQTCRRSCFQPHTPAPR